MDLLAAHRPDCVAIENIFHAKNVRSALRLGHARGVALLAASAAGLPIVEYTPAEIKRSVVGFGRAEKQQVGQMVRLLLAAGAVLPVVLGAEPSYFWVSRKADPELARLLGAAIDRLKADGELDRIYARWAAMR